MESSAGSCSPSPFLPMFEHFRSQLDEHYDRRERIIKASRDITATSKKIIFALQRVQTLNAPIAPGLLKSIAPHLLVIRKLLQNVSADLQSINFYRYHRQISPGIQEYMESLLFHHYLDTQTLLPYEAAAHNLDTMGSPEKVKDQFNEEQEDIYHYPEATSRCKLLTKGDYLLGIFDFTGELMRLAITTMATSSSCSQISLENENQSSMSLKRTTLNDLQLLRAQLAVLNYDYKSDWHFAKEADKKLEVTLTSVEKVEKALYGMVIRGSERPKGWVPDVREMGGGGHKEDTENY